MIRYCDINTKNRQDWLKETLEKLPSGLRILDAGAGRLRNKIFCNHLRYESQDFCQICDYDELGGNKLQSEVDPSLAAKIDYVCDVISIPQPNETFDVILCSEVFEHIPDPLSALDEFNRLLKPGGVLILTAPFASLVHLAPYHFVSGFSNFWYEFQMPAKGFEVVELSPNGDYFSFIHQELRRLGSLARQRGDIFWPIAYLLGVIGSLYFKIRTGKSASDVACFGWHCVARKL